MLRQLAGRLLGQFCGRKRADLTFARMSDDAGSDSDAAQTWLREQQERVRDALREDQCLIYQALLTATTWVGLSQVSTPEHWRNPSADWSGRRGKDHESTFAMGGPYGLQATGIVCKRRRTGDTSRKTTICERPLPNNKSRLFDVPVVETRHYWAIEEL